MQLKVLLKKESVYIQCLSNKQFIPYYHLRIIRFEVCKNIKLSIHLEFVLHMNMYESLTVQSVIVILFQPCLNIKLVNKSVRSQKILNNTTQLTGFNNTMWLTGCIAQTKCTTVDLMIKHIMYAVNNNLTVMGHN
jgi:hypothetical protein